MTYRSDNGGYRNPGRLEDFRQAFNNGLRTYEPIGDYLKNRNYSSKPDVLNYLKNKRLENPFKKPTTVVTQSRNQLINSNSEVQNILNRSGTCENSVSPTRNDSSFDEDNRHHLATITPNDLMKNIKTPALFNEDYPVEFARSPIPKIMNQTRNVARDGGLGFSQTLNSQSFTRTIKDFEGGQ